MGDVLVGRDVSESLAGSVRDLRIAMPKGIYSVQVVNAETGVENWVRATASSAEEARNQVAAMGEIVGAAQLIEVISDSGTAALAKEKVHHPCKHCGSTETMVLVGGFIRCVKCDRANAVAGSEQESLYRFHVPNAVAPSSRPTSESTEIRSPSLGVTSRRKSKSILDRNIGKPVLVAVVFCVLLLILVTWENSPRTSSVLRTGSSANGQAGSAPAGKSDQLAIRVYDWCQSAWDRAERAGRPISEDDGDQTIFRLAAQHFGVSTSEAEALYERGGVLKYR